MKHAVVLAVPFLLAACGSNETPTKGSEVSSSAPAEKVALTGEQIFKRCIACHQVKKDAPHGIGPNLHGIAGRTVASAEGFNFSQALKAKGGNWDDATLSAYIENPRKFAPGNRMSFAGIKDAGERQAVIEYLKEQK